MLEVKEEIKFLWFPCKRNGYMTPDKSKILQNCWSLLLFDSEKHVAAGILVFGTEFGLDDSVKCKDWACTELLQAVQTGSTTYTCCACSLTQSRPTLFNPKYCRPPSSSIQGIFQARKLEWVAISSSRGSSWPRDQTSVCCVGRQILYYCTIWGPMIVF